jgi:CoA:oxalate CoA-transferase
MTESLAATLGGLRVVDLSRAISGPYVGRILADLGADVVKIEPPEGDVSDEFGRKQAGRSGLFAQMNAGKRVVRCDFRDPAHLDIARRIIGRADVLIENFRPGVLAGFALDYLSLAARNPALIMLSISGFGADGPEAKRRAFAPVIHAESGLLTRNSFDDSGRARDLPISLADSLAALHGAVAVLAALRLRESTARGQHIDLSMLQAVLASDDHSHSALEGDAKAMPSRGLVWDAPGGPILLAMEMGGTWKRLTETFGVRDEGPADVAAAEKRARRIGIVADWIRAFESRAALLDALDRARIGWAEVRTAHNLLEQPSLQHRPPYADVDDGGGGLRRIVRMPYRFSEAADATVGPVGATSEARDVLDDWTV